MSASAPARVLPYSPRGRALTLGAVSYLNAEPHVYGLETDEGFRVERDVPSAVARRLHAGEVDLGLVPSVEFAFGAFGIVPAAAIASRGPVGSVLLFHRVPLEAVRTVALDTSSRTSSALVRVLLHERLGGGVRYVPAVPRLDDMLSRADAALMIGDPALDAATDLPRLDLGAEWTRRTGLPFVYAFWAGPVGVVNAAGVRRLQDALADGLAHVDEIAARQAGGSAERASRYSAYLRENIVFTLGEPEKAGLLEFYRRARALSLVPGVPELRFHAQD